MEKIKVDILSSQFLKENGAFSKIDAIKFLNEMKQKNFNNEDIYNHITISFNIQNIPKILVILLNNKYGYITNQNIVNYSSLIEQNNFVVTSEEKELYKKWVDIFKKKFKEQYGKIYNDEKIELLALENAKYLITVFFPTQIIYSASLKEINDMALTMKKYIRSILKNDSSSLKNFERSLIKDDIIDEGIVPKNRYSIGTPSNYGRMVLLGYGSKISNKEVDDFQKKLANYMQQLLDELDKVNVIEEKLMENKKNIDLSIFGEELDKKEEYFGDIYSTTYKQSFAYLSEVDIHKNLDYQIEILQNKEYFIPQIIKCDKSLKDEWLSDLQKIKLVNPQGEFIRINESGKYCDFVSKYQEQITSNNQLEAMLQTKETLLKYKENLEVKNHPLAGDIKHYFLTFEDLRKKIK